MVSSIFASLTSSSGICGSNGPECWRWKALAAGFPYTLKVLMFNLCKIERHRKHRSPSPSELVLSRWQRVLGSVVEVATWYEIDCIETYIYMSHAQNGIKIKASLPKMRRSRVLAGKTQQPFGGLCYMEKEGWAKCLVDGGLPPDHST